MVLDCFSFFKNLELLEIRLNSLAPYVDKFVLIEGTRTFTDQEKPLHYGLNKDRFSAFDIHHIVYEPNDSASPVEMVWNQFKYMIANLPDTDDDAMLLISDYDNIPNLKDWNGQEGVFRMERYYYCLNCYYRANWFGTNAILKKNILQTINDAAGMAEWYRRPQGIIPNGGWHFCCLGTIEDILHKYASNAHVKINTAKNFTLIRSNMENRMHPLNNVLKQRRPKKCRLQMPSGPEWLLKNKDKYQHLFY